MPTIAEVEAIAPSVRALVLLASWCGLRRVELAGLQRHDIDLERWSVTVERAINARWISVRCRSRTGE